MEHVDASVTGAPLHFVSRADCDRVTGSIECESLVVVEDPIVVPRIAMDIDFRARPVALMAIGIGTEDEYQCVLRCPTRCVRARPANVLQSFCLEEIGGKGGNRTLDPGIMSAVL